jgi:lantibiotic modifying enzyme
LSAATFLAAAVDIGKDLIRTAVPTPLGTTWETDQIVGDPSDVRVVREHAAADLYSGAAGIAWFLGHLAAATSDHDVKATAVAATKFALQTAQTLRGPESISLFSGASGVALAAFDVGAALEMPALRRQGHDLAGRLAQMVLSHPAPTDEPDLIGGLAGAAIAMVSLHIRTGDRTLLNAADALCAMLVRKRYQDGFGTSWPTRSESPARPGLCGLAHGNSGIVWALAETAWAHKKRVLPAVVEDGLRYERSWFSPEQCNWPDFRAAEPGQATPGLAWTTAWCHGALGIGAVRWRIYEKTKAPGALAEATAAIQAGRSLVAGAGQALREGKAADATICHGLGGAIELMLLAYEITGQHEHLRAARRTGDLCLSIFQLNGGRWTLGLRDATRVPGLFVGLAGIGTVMMRLHDPRLVPSPALFGRLTTSNSSHRVRRSVRRAPA